MSEARRDEPNDQSVSMDDTTEFHKEVDEYFDNGNTVDDDEDMLSMVQRAMYSIESKMIATICEDKGIFLELMRVAGAMGNPKVSEVYSPP